uniref:Obscurin, cytoskeletal calmodulin and titin-interacting RhoGEF a n=1 Tax=Oryzias latipes TaxID=8090 RepID=A0A3P9LJQ0_ORYLA
MRTFISNQLILLESRHQVPVNVLSQKEIIFRNIKDIVILHEGCTTDDDVAALLIKHREDFEKYLLYMGGQAQAEACISDKAVQQCFKELIKNKAKSGQSCYLLEDAFSLVSCLPWRSNNLHQVSLIENYPAPLTALGEPVRQGVFTVREESPEIKATSRGHQRQVFLFKECVVLCKLKKDSSMSKDTYAFKNKMKQLNDVEIRESVGGDERSWGLWHEHRGSIRRYILQAPSSLVKLSWLKDLKELQQSPVFESQLLDFVAKIGQTIKLTCRVSGSPKPLISWIKGLPLEDDPRHIITTDRSGRCNLILDSLTPEDSGQYLCYATSCMGSAGTLAKVVVQPPRFVSRLESACLIEGEDTQFCCSTFPIPLPRVWLKDGKELTDQQKYTIVSDARSGILSLTVVGATEADIGQYECELWNELGCVKPPSIQVPTEDLCVQPGQPATFTAIVTGRPAPKIQWFKDGGVLVANENVKMVQHGARCSLTVVCSEGEDSGIYTCYAHNDSGQASCEAQLTVEEPLESQEREVELGKRRKLFSVYDVHEEIGGTFGVVKRVIHRRTGEVFAAKFLPLRSSTRTRAFQERDLLSRLAHPRIACLLDFFCTRRTLVLISECCSHGLLDHLLLQSSVSEKEIQSYIQQILEGVGHIHSMNILHLDIKPDNILMVYPPRDEIKICDFGFCQEIDASRHQYSMFGTPEFVAPEIVHQEPVTVASDIAVGVVTYLLVGRCPFVGETDRATLLMVGEGTLNWDTPDVNGRSSEAKKFLRMVLQPDPKRPSAMDCLSHEWFQGEDTDKINTRSLKVFICKRKWQRSLTCIGSVLTLRPLPELLDAPLRETSVTVPREPQAHSSTSLSSGSSSEYDEADSWDFFQHCSQTEEEVETDEEFDPMAERAQIPEPFSKCHFGGEDDEGTLGEEEDEEMLERRSGMERSISRQSFASSTTTDQGTPQRERRFSKDSNPSLYLSEGDEGSGSDGGRIPRGSVIRSTFYNTSQQLSPMSARHMTLRDKFQAKKQERGRKPLRRSFSGRLNEPLIEYVEDETDTGRAQRRGSVQPAMQKSCSFDSGVSLAHINLPPHRRSRSLDEYSRRSPSSPIHVRRSDEEGTQSMKEDFTDSDAAGRSLPSVVHSQRASRRRGSVTPGQRSQTLSGSSPASDVIAGGRMGSRLEQAQTEEEAFTGSQGSLVESFILAHGEWTILADQVTDSCYAVKDLPRGASYVFRVGCITKTASGPFSEASSPVVMATHPEVLIPLVQIESLESKVTVGEGQTSKKSYSFLSEINGRFSVLTLCRDAETSHVFAAKITFYQSEQRQLVLREYQLLRRLHHSHLVQLHDALIAPSHVVLVEELCPGKELLHSLAARDLYAETHVTELLVQILSAVDYLHSRRVVHLDLKSDNMLVDDCNHLKIVDFGSAQCFVPGQPLHIEHIHGFSDSKYIVLPKAPEILEGQGVGPETDVWAVGVLSFILSADSPFEADHSWEQDKHIKKGKIQFGCCYPGLSEGALTFMKSSLNNKPGRPTAAECLQNPWLRAHRATHRARYSKVCFSTDKLKAYLEQKEEKRDQVRTKIHI